MKHKNYWKKCDYEDTFSRENSEALADASKHFSKAGVNFEFLVRNILSSIKLLSVKKGHF